MTTLKLPRTIRLDPSDRFVFREAAEPGEWAVTGSFLFVDAETDALRGKDLVAFRSGFVGVESFGFSTLVVVSEADEAELERATALLAAQLRVRFGAPDEAAARAAAREELLMAASICGPPVNTVLALHRTGEADGIREQFRALRPREGAIPGADPLHAHARAFAFVEVDEDEPAERVDLAGLVAGVRP